MSWGAWSALLQSLTLPQDAGPNDPRIVIGPRIPTQIATMTYQATTLTTLAAIIQYVDADRYYFTALASDGTLVGLYNGVVDETAPLQNELVYDSQRLITTAAGNAGIRRIIGGTLLGIEADQVQTSFNTGTVEFDDDCVIEIDGYSAARGYRAFNPALTSSAGFTAQTAVHQTEPVFSVEADRLYLLRFVGRLRSTAAGDQVRLRIREGTTTGGSLIRDVGTLTVRDTTNGVPVDVSTWVSYASAGSNNGRWCLTAQRVAGAGTITYDREMASCEDISAYPFTAP